MVENEIKVKAGAKQKILDALKVMLIINMLSLSDITIAGICRKAGITRKTFYRYYSGKDEAVRDLVQTQIDKACDATEEIINSNQTFIEKLHDVQKLIYISYKDEFTSGFIKQANINAPEIIEYHNKAIQALYKKIELLIVQGMNDGYVKTELEPDCIVALLYTTAISLNNYRFSVVNKFDTDFIIRQAFDIILYGILKN